jgi:hypothetical protein
LEKRASGFSKPWKKSHFHFPIPGKPRCASGQWTQAITVGVCASTFAFDPAKLSLTSETPLLKHEFA